jgi:hypothetical protein
MIVAGSASPLLLSSAGGYNLTRSLRLRSSASAYLNRTPASAGNRRTWTYSAWVKRGRLNATQYILESGSADTATDRFIIRFNSDNTILVTRAGTADRITTQVFRDPSAWYHIIVAVDTTQATADNRIKLYINGSQVTSFSSLSNPSQNADTGVNAVTPQNIGRSQVDGGDYFDGYQAEINLVDGQALTPSSFGANSPTTGVWQPKKYAGTYGTNGFYLPFTNNSTTTTLGNDFSGNGNNWTTNNISLTAGSTYDSMTDVPTLTSATASNFPTLNPLDIQSTSELPSGGNLNANGGNNMRATMACASTGKYYYEYTRTNTTDAAHTGIFATSSPITSLTSGSMLYRNDGTLFENDVPVITSWATYTTNDVIGVAVNCDTSQISFYKNNTLQGTRSFVSQITSSNAIFAIRNNTGATASVNFGQRPFAYTPPTGFVALNTFNLPTPTIGATASTLADDYFNIALYTGNATARTISGLGFQPDFNWTKPRNAVGSHVLTDSVRGVTKFLETNSTGVEQTGSTGIQSWNSDGYALGTGNDWNASGETFVSWNWRASGSTVSNTAGSITSTVSANTSAGFSVVTYTGNGTNGATIGHGLGVAPRMIITKPRNTENDWYVYHASMGNTRNIYLNTTGASTTSNLWWSATTPSSTVFTVGDQTGNNGSGINIVAYCFSEVAGYSAFGSYTGNASTDGPFVFTGFRPAFIMLKRTDSTANWQMKDKARIGYNPDNYALFANLSNQEYGTVSDISVDHLSNGFKVRTADAGYNASGGTYIYMAFAENPFKYSLAR